MTAEPEPTISVVIADDEPLARSKIKDFLTDVHWVRCVGEARNGPETVAIANRLRPGVVFLDVRMPGLDGFQVLSRLEYSPAVVFTTAHDDYAVTAFEVRALDYLVKPFGRTRFLSALSRVRETLDDPSRDGAVARGREALERGLAPPVRQLYIRAPRRILPVDVADITRFEASDDYVTVYTNGKQLLAAVRMDDLEGMLDPTRFLRIHRSHIVNLSAVTSIAPHPSGRFAVTMRDGTVLFASRSRSRAVRRRSV